MISQTENENTINISAAEWSLILPARIPDNVHFQQDSVHFLSTGAYENVYPDN